MQEVKPRIDETIDKWFEEIRNELQPLRLPKTRIDETIMASIPVVHNYLNCVLAILQNDRRLPAKALLRISGEFVAKLIYCLSGKIQRLGVSERFDAWGKTSLMKRKRYYENIRDVYAGSNRKTVEKWIDETQREIDKIKGSNLPKTASIFADIFGQRQPVCHAGMYLQYLGAVHIDLETLARTIKTDTKGIEYMGDIEEKVEDLRLDSLTQVYMLFREVYRYYSLDFGKTENEYRAFMPQGNMK
jgi:hypothetical protein